METTPLSIFDQSCCGAQASGNRHPAPTTAIATSSRTAGTRCYPGATGPTQKLGACAGADLGRFRDVGAATGEESSLGPYRAVPEEIGDLEYLAGRLL